MTNFWTPGRGSGGSGLEEMEGRLARLENMLGLIPVPATLPDFPTAPTTGATFRQLHADAITNTYNIVRSMANYFNGFRV